MKLLLAALAFSALCLYVVVSQHQVTFEDFLLVHNCAPEPAKKDPMGRPYREYDCGDGIGRVGPYYEK